MSEQTSEVKHTYKVLPGDFKGAEFELKQYAVKIRAGVAFDAIKDNPATWAHIAGKLADGDIIHVRTEDRAYYARLIVLTVQKQAAKVHVLEYHELPKGAVPKEYIVAFGGRHKWRVLRAADKVVMEHGFATQEEAAAHADELSKKLAA
jgi:hypothetical protein